MKFRNIFLCPILFPDIISASRVENALFQYDFTKSACNAKLIKDVSRSSRDSYFGDLKRGGLSNCANHHGVFSGAITDFSLPGVESVKNCSSLLDTLQLSTAKEFSFEIWLHHESVKEIGDAQSLIASISNYESPAQFGFDFQHQSNLDLTRLSHLGYYFRLRSRTSSNDRESSQKGTIRGPTENDVTASRTGLEHIVVTVDYSDAIAPNFEYNVSIFRNGEQRNDIIPFDSTFNEQSWNNSYHLQLFSDFRTRYLLQQPEPSYRPWSGGIYRIAMYNTALTKDEVRQNFDAGIPQNPPEISPVRIYLYEDGMAHPQKVPADLYFLSPTITEVANLGYSPECFKSPIPVQDLDIFYFPIPYDHDDFLQDASYNISLVNRGSPHLSQYENFSIYILTLPEKGSIYFVNGTEVEHVQTRVHPHMRFRPLENDSMENKLIVYASFEYYCVDIRTGENSTVSRANFYVQPVNDPPEPYPIEANVSISNDNLLCVTGKDVDGEIKNGQILTLPKKGVLFQADQEYYGIAKRGNKMAVGDFFVRDKYFGAQCIYYIYTGSNKSDRGNADEFEFRVVDELGSTSVRESAKLTIWPSFINNGSSPLHINVLSIIEESCSYVQLFVIDNTKDSDMTFYIDELPTHGSLFDLYSMEKICVGGEISTISKFPHREGVNIYYCPEKDYFNINYLPRSSSNAAELDSFRYHADSSSKAKMASTTVQLKVMNVNDKTELSCPANQYSVKVVKNFTEEKYAAVIDGFIFIDPDLGQGKVRVSVNSKYGYLSLVPQYISFLDFESMSDCFGQSFWHCSGTGTGDRRMTFVSTPMEAQLALNGLKYWSTTPNVNDTISITIYDGFGDSSNRNCIAGSLQIDTSLPKECFIESCNVEVKVSEMLETESSDHYKLKYLRNESMYYNFTNKFDAVEISPNGVIEPADYLGKIASISINDVMHSSKPPKHDESKPKVIDIVLGTLLISSVVVQFLITELKKRGYSFESSHILLRFFRTNSTQ